jgi:RHS repeat-associated protein
MSDATGSSAYAYDPFGELTSAQNGTGQTVSYSYDYDGNQTSITYPLPGTHSWATTTTVGYGYDHADIRTSVTDFNNQQIAVTPNADALPSSVTLGSTGDTISTTYDNTDTPSAITLQNSSTTLQSFTYSDAPAGTILSETDTPSSPQSPAGYAYDARSRVTSDTPGSGSAKSYSFDASSNLTTLPTGATGTYDHAGELTSSALSGTTTSYTYNADGEQLTSVQGSTTTSAATWNGTRQLATYDNTAANMTAAAYGGNGLRASTTITPSGGSAVSQGYVWNAQPQTPQLLMDGVNAYVYTTGSAPAEQVNLATGTVTYLVADLLGSIRGTVSSAGALTATTAYDAWGNPGTTGGLTAATPFGYAGGYTDPSGLIYLINRYYDPTTGQFTSLDPAVDSTLQPYAYAAGDPIINTDPTGEYCSTTRAMLEMGQTCSSITTASGKKPYSKQSAAQLTPEEEAAVAAKNKGRPYDHAVFNRAMQKIKQAEKYAGQRNKSKRGNSKFVATATAATAGVAGAIWLWAKLASPACGPFVALCALGF